MVKEKKAAKKASKKEAHGHGPPKGAILLRKADGTPFTRKVCVTYIILTSTLDHTLLML